MKHSKGNDKLGNCGVMSRPVGDTCPSTCWFLGNGCYAEATENRFPNAREYSQNNILTQWRGIKRFIEKYADKRIHERGDWFINGKLDRRYLYNWCKALRESNKRGKIWTYTHILDKRLLTLERYGVKIYASVNTPTEAEYARSAGFSLIAYCTDIKKKKGGSRDVTTYIDLPVIGRTLVCPEQRLGRKRVTCAGTKTTTRCGWCIDGRGDVAFLEH
jgi:hypothetical protein